MSLITSIAEAEAMLRASNSRTGSSSGSRNVSSSAGFSDILKQSFSNISEDMDAIFEEAASKFQISSDLLRAVAKAESNFNPNAVSGAGAMGVMQLMPGTAKSLGVSDPFDARQNIMGGAKYLKENLDKFGDVKLALAAYNAGPGAVQKYGGIPPYKETQNYVQKITSYLEGDTIYANRSVTTGGSSGGSSGNSMTDFGSYISSLGSYGVLNSLTSGVGSYAGSDSYAGLGGLSGYSGLGSYAALNGYGGLGSYTALNGYSGLSSYAGLSGITDSLSSLGIQQDGDTVTMDKDTFSSLIQMIRIQTMMNASREVGFF